MEPVAVILKDTHLQEFNIETNISLFDQAIEFCKDNEIKTILHLGDIFHSRKSQPQIILTVFEQILDKIASAELQMIAIVGNHDKTDYDSKDSFLAPFKHHPALSLIEETGYERLQTSDGKNINLAFASYFSEEIYVSKVKELNTYVEAWLRDIGEQQCIMCTHIGVNGAVMNNGMKIESSVKTSLFKQYKEVFIGHYHDGHSWSNIRYLGASLQHNFGERDGKGMDVLFSDYSTELVPLEYPRYIKYEVDVNSLTQKDLDDLRNEKQNSNDFLRVVLVGDEKDVKSYNIQALKQVGVDVQMKTPDIEISELQTRIEPFTTTTLLEQFETFCQENELDHAKGLEYFNKIIAQNV